MLFRRNFAICDWLVLSDEQMSKGCPFSLLNDEQMSNWLGVEHQPGELQSLTEQQPKRWLFAVYRLWLVNLPPPNDTSDA